MSTFTGFSEEDLQRMKSTNKSSNNAPQINTSTTNLKRLDKIGARTKRITNQYKSPILKKQDSDDAIDGIQFDKCKLTIKTPTTPTDNCDNENINDDINITINYNNEKEGTLEVVNNDENKVLESRKNSVTATPDVRVVKDYSQDELASHSVKLEELQLKQKLMEEQNKKRKEMLAKALADRTKQTAEEVLKLEKIKKELQVLDSQFSQDVNVLRKKIDVACLCYADAEKHYLKVEKEFLQAKINLQKEREKKELLTEHLCALITHNETRKAQKLETLMLELASDRKNEINDVQVISEDEVPVIVDGVDQKTGKIVEFNVES